MAERRPANPGGVAGASSDAESRRARQIPVRSRAAPRSPRFRSGRRRRRRSLGTEATWSMPAVGGFIPRTLAGMPSVAACTGRRTTEGLEASGVDGFPSTNPHAATEPGGSGRPGTGARTAVVPTLPTCRIPGGGRAPRRCQAGGIGEARPRPGYGGGSPIVGSGRVPARRGSARRARGRRALTRVGDRGKGASPLRHFHEGLLSCRNSISERSVLAATAASSSLTSTSHRRCARGAATRCG